MVCRHDGISELHVPYLRHSIFLHYFCPLDLRPAPKVVERSFNLRPGALQLTHELTHDPGDWLDGLDGLEWWGEGKKDDPAKRWVAPLFAEPSLYLERLESSQT